MSNEKIKIGKKAPSFTTTDQHGRKHKLSEYKNQNLILYFYPKDDTPGCTAEAQSFTKDKEKLEQKGYTIMGISPQDQKSHYAFAQKYDINFPLLVDKDHVIAERYGVWVEKNMYGNKYMGVQRSTFIIGEGAEVLDIIGRTKTKDAAQQVLDRIEKLEN